MQQRLNDIIDLLHTLILLFALDTVHRILIRNLPGFPDDASDYDNQND